MTSIARMVSLNELFTEISSLRRRLEDLPQDAYDERVKIRSRITELHAEAHEIEEEMPLDREHLEAELRELMAEHDAIVSGHVDPVSQSGSLSASVPGDTSGAQNINRAIDAAADLSRLEKHIRELKRRLGHL